MPSGITINGVFLPRVSLGSLDTKKEELQDYIKSLEQKLLALAAQSPTVNRDCESNEIPWHDYVTAEVNELLQEYRDSSRELYLVGLAIENLGYAPEDVTDDHFLDSGAQWKLDHGFTKGPVEVCYPDDICTGASGSFGKD